MCLFDSQILFSKRAGSVGVNALKHYLKRLWLVAIATILSKTFKIHFLTHNWSFFTNLNKLFGAYRGYLNAILVRKERFYASSVLNTRCIKSFFS